MRVKLQLVMCNDQGAEEIVTDVITLVLTDKPFAHARADMQAAMTHLGRIGRRDQDHFHPSQCRFIRNKLSQLKKMPSCGLVP